MACTMKLAAFALAMSGLGFGLAAARYWWKSTRVPVDPLDGNPNAIMPVVPELAQQAWWAAQFRANQEIGRLNTVAAILTAVAVVLSTASSVIAMF
ncbi:hypothetical protein R69658_06851 [Paraburkholderia aspalathi]|uniref:Uncharacterized protein n=2 Tax=Paraburkholderia aspalathi TaxID=1324617 RepID=A0ABN7N516_9BURK|nr:hypothetical protein [Paraburkholderia aspalathi]MBK3835041.1 hypothetical protein [Paraburkholderia aspalathi]MBK3864787.1 hypothetical protein [Paraburkholderia aspalathi]CAE6843923.1 hypothetical protein R69658_06851 [Paraburkholderia aspalathi]